MKIAVLGATGAVGQHAVAALLERGLRVRAVSRSLPRLERAFGRGSERLELTAADVSQPTGAARALEDCTGALHTVGLPYRKREFARYPALMQVALDAARRAGVERVIQISNVYPYGRPRTRPVAETHPLEPCSVKGRHRLEQEQVTLAAHGDGLETLVLRLPNFFGKYAEQSALAVAARAVAKGQAAPLLEPIDAQQEFVVLQDVGQVVARLFFAERGFGQALNMAGTGLASPRELAALLAEAAGAPLRIRALGKRAQQVVGWFVRDLAELAEMSYLAESPLVLDESRLRDVLGEAIRHTSFADAARDWIAHERAPNPTRGSTTPAAAA